MNSLFNQAREHVASGNLLDAVGVLNRAWLAKPSPRLGDLIDAINTKIAAAPIEEKWISLARNHDVHDLGGLIATLRSGTLKYTTLRVRALAAYGRDPRIASALFKILCDVPFTSNGSRPTWLVIFERLAALGDPRVIERMDAAKRNWGIRENQRTWLEPRADALVLTLRKTLSAADYALDADEAKALSQIDEALAKKNKRSSAPTQSAGDFLDAIHQDPADDDRRAVYADWLQDRDDPRGEFIALQLKNTERTKPQLARERTLLKQFEREWLGAIAPVVNKGGTAFARGFLVACDVRFKNERDVRAYGSLPAWGTVERLRHGLPGSPPLDQMKWLTWIDPAMKSLRDVDVFPESLPALCNAKEPWLIEKIDWDTWHTGAIEQEAFRLFEATDKLPKLRSLSLREPPLAPWISRARFASTLRELTLVHAFDGPELLEAFLADTAKLTNLEQIVLTIHPIGTSAAHWKQHITLTRDRNGRHTLARALVDTARLHDVSNALMRLPKGALTELTVAAHPEIPSKLDSRALPDLKTAAKRHGLVRFDLTI